jgi:hypothetical protein
LWLLEGIRKKLKFTNQLFDPILSLSSILPHFVTTEKFLDRDLMDVVTKENKHADYISKWVLIWWISLDLCVCAYKCINPPPPPCVCVCVCMCPGTYMPQYTWIRMWSVITFYLLWDGILCICLASWTGKFRESPRLHPPSFISSGMKVFTTISGFTWFLGLWTQFIILALLCADRKGWCFCICLSKVR